MEARSENTIIKVDNAKFVKCPASRMTLEACIAFIDLAIKTEAYKEMNVRMLQLLHSVIQKQKDQEQQDTFGSDEQFPKGEW